MTRADFKAFSNLMQALAECYGKTLSAQGIALRFQLLASHDIADVRRAAMSILSTRKYTSMPTPADFLELLNGGLPEDLAEVEAGKVLEAVSEHGAYASVVFDNAVTQAVIVRAYRGWPQLCSILGTEESELWFRRNFVKIWQAYSRQNVAVTGHLPGLTELENSRNGFLEALPCPILIGDREKARSLLREAENIPISQILLAAEGDK